MQSTPRMLALLLYLKVIDLFTCSKMSDIDFARAGEVVANRQGTIMAP